MVKIVISDIEEIGIRATRGVIVGNVHVPYGNGEH